MTVTDSTGASGTSPAFTWTVYAAPSVTSPGAQASSVGTVVSLSLATTCPNSPCTYSLNSNAPAGLSINSSATISGTITGNPTTYASVIVSVTDAGGATTSSAAFNWVVNPAPKILSPGDQRTAPSGVVSLKMAGYASGGTGSYSYSAAGLPSWLSINATTGVISGTAPATTSTTTGITVTLKDATNASSTTVSFAWVVNNVLVTTFGSQTTYKATAVNLDLDNYTSGGTGPYTYTATGLPSWLTLNRTTGALTGTAPTVAASTTTKTANIVITATDSASPQGHLQRDRQLVRHGSDLDRCRRQRLDVLDATRHQPDRVQRSQLRLGWRDRCSDLQRGQPADWSQRSVQRRDHRHPQHGRHLADDAVGHRLGRCDGRLGHHLEDHLMTGLPGLPARILRRRPTGDDGTTLMELMIGMVIMTILMTICTTAIVTMFAGTGKTQAVANSAQQLNTAFVRLDDQVRYATSIDQPTPDGLSVAFLRITSTSAGTTRTCLQLRIQTVAGTSQLQLMERSWPVNADGSVSTGTRAVHEPARGRRQSHRPERGVNHAFRGVDADGRNCAATSPPAR